MSTVFNFTFVPWFRSVAPYIHKFRHQTFVIGLPGERIQIKDGVLNINDKPVMRDFRDVENISDDGRSAMYRRYIETLPNGVQHYIYELSDNSRYDNTPVYTVPAGHYFMTRAFAVAPLTVTQPVTFLQLVWATLLGALAFGEAVDPWVLLGGAIIILAISYITWREAALKRPRLTPATPRTEG